MATENQQIFKDGLLKEYEFVTSLIPLYRQFQMQLVRYGYLVYTAAIGLLVSSFQISSSTQSLERIAYSTIGLLPFLISMILFMFLTTEIRIKRASLFIVREIAPKMKELTGGCEVFTWELNPSQHLSPKEEKLSSSGSLIYALALPAIAGSICYLCKAKSLGIIPCYCVVIGLIMTITIACCALTVSRKHEGR